MKWTLRKIARFRKINIVKHYVFSVSLTGIVRSPHFERWIRVCINKVLVCFVIHDFVIWCIFLFPIFSFCIKVAGVQTSSSQRKSPAPRPLVTVLLLFSSFRQFKVILYVAKITRNYMYCVWAPLTVMVCCCVTAFQGNVSEQSFHHKEKTLLRDPMETGSPFQFPHSDESHSFTNQTANLNWHPNVLRQGIILSVRGE